MKYQKLQELDQANILLNFLNVRDNSNLKILNPNETPDFTLNDGTGLEVTQLIAEELKKTNTVHDEISGKIRKALYSEKLPRSYQLNIYINNRKIFFSKNNQLNIIKCIIDFVKNKQVAFNKYGIEKIDKKIIRPNYNSQRYIIELLEENPDKTSKIKAYGVRGFYYIEKSKPLARDIQIGIDRKVKKYSRKKLLFKRLLVFISHDADYWIDSKLVFESACAEVKNTWKNVFKQIYCIVSMSDIDYGTYPSKFEEYLIYDFQEAKSYLFNNEKKELTG